MYKMKKLNLLTFIFSIALIYLIAFNWNHYSEVMVFYGFANNQEININLENSAKVKNILISPGQRVSKGDILIQATRSSIAVSQSDINYDISKLESQYHLWESGLKNSLRTLRAQKIEQKNQLENAISKLESEMKINETLIKGIESIDQVKDHNGSNPRKIQLDGLKEDLRLSMITYNSEIGKIQKELSNTKNPIKIQIAKLGNNLEFVNEEESNLNITAPNDGVVGSIFCKIGENIPAFSPYLTIYEEVPTHVKGYVLESMIPNIEKKDSLKVQSVSHSGLSITGVVSGMGSRIIEIPTRLRKNPNFSTYGREIEIRIPKQNPFLQNEKVILKTIYNTKIRNQFKAFRN